jgi:hypothetical protein
MWWKMTNLRTNYFVIPKGIDIDDFFNYLEKNRNVKSYFKITKESADKIREGR